MQVIHKNNSNELIAHENNNGSITFETYSILYDSSKFNTGCITLTKDDVLKMLEYFELRNVIKQTHPTKSVISSTLRVNNKSYI